MASVAYNLLKVIDSTVLTLITSDDDIVEQYTMGSSNASAQGALAIYCRPVVIDIGIGEYVDFKFAKFPYVWGLAASSNSNASKYQLYDNAGVQQFRGSVGGAFIMIGNPPVSGTADGCLFNDVDNAGWYLRITNQGSTLMTVSVLVLGSFTTS